MLSAATLALTALTLTACTSGTDTSTAQSPTATTATESSTPAAAGTTSSSVPQRTREDLTAAVDATRVGTQKFAVLSDATRSQADAIAKEMRAASTTPGVCRDVALQVLASGSSTAGTTVSGMSEDSQSAVLVANYSTAQTALGEYTRLTSVAQKCASFTLTMNGQTSRFTVESADAAVDGAQASRQMIVRGDLGGNPQSTALVWALRAGDVVMGQNLSDDAADPARSAAAALLSHLPA